jgi:hypothetical protein
LPVLGYIATNNAAENEIIDSNFLPTKIFVHPSSLNENGSILILKYHGIFLPTRTGCTEPPRTVEVTQGPRGQHRTLQSASLV